MIPESSPRPVPLAMVLKAVSSKSGLGFSGQLRVESNLTGNGIYNVALISRSRQQKFFLLKSLLGFRKRGRAVSFSKN